MIIFLVPDRDSVAIRHARGGGIQSTQDLNPFEIQGSRLRGHDGVLPDCDTVSKR